MTLRGILVGIIIAAGLALALLYYWFGEVLRQVDEFNRDRDEESRGGHY